MTKSSDTDISKKDSKKLYFQAVKQSSVLFFFLCLIFFIPSWTLRYWEAWVYIGVFMLMMNLNLIYLLKRDPDLLRRRLKRKEEREPQKWIMKFANLAILMMFTFPSIDNRFAWSNVPLWIVLLADSIIIGTYGFFVWVLRTNSYASHTIEVDKENQKIITTGPYAIVRHPLYLAASILFGLTPLALGSWWGLLGNMLFIPLLITRILDEEKMLIEELEGYEEYMKKTKYRVIPWLF